MASLKLEHIYKVYPNGTKAVNDFSLDIKDKEFIVFVGPSGCGKSTTLRMIAGLEEISAGELYIGDTLVNDIEPKDRDIAMVFQNYALYPHMTVYENMAFGLTLRHVPRDEIHEKVMWAADVLGLRDYLDRKPRAMSGGQRQRVALGRAILRNPKVMLLDEPLSNLDAKLRSQMRSEISKLHLKLQTTFIYVTHDQVEAMTLGTRVVVMRAGRIQQVDTPKNLYDYPANKFVAGFIGTPQMNFFNVKLLRNKDKVAVNFLEANNELVVPLSQLLKVNKAYLNGEKDSILGLRCEDISLTPTESTKNNGIKVYVSHFEELGNETLIYAELDKESLGKMDSTTKIIIKANNSMGLKYGDEAIAYFNMDKAHFFDAKNEKSISPRIPESNTLLCEISGNKITLAGVSFRLPPVYLIDKLEGDAIVPIEAVSLGKKGDIEATITKVETIDDKHLIYLESNGVVFFALGDGSEKEGQKVFATFDFSKTTFVDTDGAKFEPLRDYDDMTASFINLKTAIHDNPEETLFEDEKNRRVDAVDAKYSEKINALISERDAALEEIDNSDVDAIIAEDQSQFAELKAEANEVLGAAKIDYKASLKDVKARQKAAVADVKAEIKDTYAKRIQAENEDYKFIISTNKDKEVIRSRKAEHTLFKENLPREKEHDLERRLSAVALDFDTEKNALKASHNRTVFDYKNKIKQLKEKLAFDSKLRSNTEAKYNKQIAALTKEMEHQKIIAGLVFFFNIDGHHMIIPEFISNKIIQGLGNKVFSRSYRISVPHDGFTLVEEKGIIATVKSVDDFGSHKYFHAFATVYDQEFDFYLDASVYPELEINKEFRFELNFEKCKISETSMNIRLY